MYQLMNNTAMHPVLAAALWNATPEAWQTVVVILVLLGTIELLLARRFRLHEQSEQKYINKFTADYSKLLEQTIVQLNSFDTALGTHTSRLEVHRDQIAALTKRVEDLERQPKRNPNEKPLL